MDVVITEAALRETGRLFCCMPPHNSDAYRTPSVSKSIKESIRLGRITSTDVLKATRQKPGAVLDRLIELYELGLVSRHGKSRAAWYVREPHTQYLLQRRPTSKW